MMRNPFVGLAVLFVAGCSPPVVSIVQPEVGDLFNHGDLVHFQGQVSDNWNRTENLTLEWASDVDGVLNTAGADSSGLTAFTFDSLSIGSQTVTLTATDSHGLTGSASVDLWVNGFPSAPVVSIAPSPAYTTDALTVTIDTASEDPEGAEITYRYDWTRDGVPMTVSTTSSLPASETKKGETWGVNVTPNDGQGDGDSGTARLIIQNTPPTVPGVSIDPPTPLAGVNDLVCEVVTTATDVDGDTVSYRMSWTVDSVAHTGSTATTTHTDDTIPANETSKQEVWTCTVTPNDGQNDGGTASATVTIVGTDCPEVLDGIDNDSDGTVDNVSLSCADAIFDGGVLTRASSRAGDVNGDGYDDILFGNYGWADTGSAHGAAFVYEGTETGITGSEFADADAILTGVSSGDWAGNSVASAGDINNDGYDDILVGAAYAGSTTTGAGPGQAYLFLGTSTGLTSAYLSSADAVLTGEHHSHLAGRRVSGAGDVNDDGYDDILIGAPYWTNPTWAGSQFGTAYLIHGGPTGISTMELSSADATFHGEKSGHKGGTAVSGAGDVDGDGVGDFMVSAEYADRGATYVFLGDSAGFSDMNLSDADARFTGISSRDWAGFSVANAGDVNGDGYDDMFIGAPYALNGPDDNGAAYLVLGHTTAPVDMSLSSADAAFSGEDAGDSAGYSVSGAGDVNGDTYNDLLIGAYRSDQQGDNSGIAYLILGESSGLSDRSLADADARFLSEDEKMEAGISVSGAGDTNGDGYDDLLITAPGQTAEFSSSGGYLLLGAGF